MMRIVPAPILVAVLLAPALAPATQLTRGPYLQRLTTQSVTVVWKTDVPAACSLAIHPVGGSATTVAGPTRTVCAILADGLRPGTQYAYTPNADGVALRAESVFSTDDRSRTAFTFIAVGDSGSGDANQLAVRDRMVATPTDFLVHTGDMVYPDGAAADFDAKFFAPYEDLIRRVMFWPCLGNHDMHAAKGQPWRDAFWTPANNPAGSKNYYAFDFGNAHVIVLDSNQTTSADSPQHKFLAYDLAATDRRWKVVVFHRTIYSNSKHGSDLTIRANLVPLFDKYGVDLVLMGHDHDYERTKPLVNNAVVGPNEGTVYITTGGGGKNLYPAGTSALTAYSESTYHFTRVAVDGDRLVEEMIRADGTVGDRMMRTKGASTTTTTTGGPR